MHRPTSLAEKGSWSLEKAKLKVLWATVTWSSLGSPLKISEPASNWNSDDGKNYSGICTRLKFLGRSIHTHFALNCYLHAYLCVCLLHNTSVWVHIILNIVTLSCRPRAHQVVHLYITCPVGQGLSGGAYMHTLSCRPRFMRWCMYTWEVFSWYISAT